MSIPSLSKFLCILINSVKKKVMKKPNMLRLIGTKTTVNLQFLKKPFPLATKGACDIEPEALYPGIVNASMCSY